MRLLREVLGNGKYGVLIENPNIVSEWVEAMNNSIAELKSKGNIYKDRIPEDLYGLDIWCDSINQYVNEAKHKLIS